MKSILVAYDKNRGIGAGNDMPWQRSLSADLAYFKELTSGNAVIMGRKTFESIGRPLPGRQNIVLSRAATFVDGAVVVPRLEAAYAAVAPGKEAFVIGGGQIYRLAMDTADRIYATEIDASFPQADVFFPRIDAAVWKETSRTHHEADERNAYAFDWVIYDRRTV
jgi:dihydrofolate reductase